MKADTAKRLFFTLFYLSMFLLFLVGCQKTEKDNPVAKDKPVVKGDTMVIAISEKQEPFYRTVIGSYCSKYPDVKVSIVTIPLIDNQSTQENEEKTNQMDQMRVEIMAGKGPDVFLLDKTNSLFSDIVKNCYNGTFYDMESLLGETIKNGDFMDTVMEAGVIGDGRYLIPLGFTMSGILTTAQWLDGWEPTATQPAPFLTEMLERVGVEKFASTWAFFYNLSSFTKEGLLNYEEETSVVSDELLALCELAQKQELATPLEEILPISLTQFGSPEAYAGEGELTSLLLNGETPIFLPIPNGSGTTAQIGTYGAVRANSGYTAEAKDLFTFLLSNEVQGSDRWESLPGLLSRLYTLPVNQIALEENLRYRLTPSGNMSGNSEEILTQVEAAVQMLFEKVQLVDTARFTAYEDQLLYEYVIKTLWSKELTLEEGLELMEEEQRFYFSE